jgi:hypothetical protein
MVIVILLPHGLLGGLRQAHGWLRSRRRTKPREAQGT